MKLSIFFFFFSILNPLASFAEEPNSLSQNESFGATDTLMEGQNSSESLPSQKDASAILKGIEESIQTNPEQASENFSGDIDMAQESLDRTYILQEATQNALLDRIQQLTAIVEAQEEAIRNFKDLVADLKRENEALKNDQ